MFWSDKSIAFIQNGLQFLTYRADLYNPVALESKGFSRITQQLISRFFVILVRCKGVLTDNYLSAISQDLCSFSRRLDLPR